MNCKAKFKRVFEHKLLIIYISDKKIACFCLYLNISRDINSDLKLAVGLKYIIIIKCVFLKKKNIHVIHL